MSPSRLLVIDPDPSLRHLLSRYLGQRGYHVDLAESAQQARQIFARANPDLVILDLNLPDGDGCQLCEQLQQGTGVFVLMLSRRCDEADMVAGLTRGADDFITKPFSLAALEAHIQAILRRKRIVEAAQQQCIEFERLVIDPVRRAVEFDGEAVPLTALEFDLLHFLASHPGRVWRRTELIQEVWEYEYVGDQRVVDVHIGQIRKKLERDPSHPSVIQTVRGVGYKFEQPELPEAG